VEERSRNSIRRLGLARLVARRWDALAWRAARSAVDAVRYEPRHLDVVMACGASQPEVPQPLVNLLSEAREQPVIVKTLGLPRAVVRAVAARTALWFGPTASALVRWFSGATATAADRAGGETIERWLRARAHPGLLVPHPHALAVLAADMRGFSNLTRELQDTQYLADLISEYLTELTRVVEHHRGIVFQYTGDGLLAVFLPELAGAREGEMLDRLVNAMCLELHRAFDVLHARWQAEWREQGRRIVPIGLGVGMSFGRATIGFIGPAGKKHIGVVGEPINLAAFLCSQAQPGAVLIDRASFARAGIDPPPAKVARLRSKKPHQRIETVCLRYGARRPPAALAWLPTATPR